MAETRFDPTQIELAGQSSAIVQYLRAIAKQHKHLGEAFECANGRLFFNMENIVLPTEVDAVLSSDLLADYFWRKIETVGTTINELAFRYIKKAFVDYFFHPIEESAAWQQFWAEQAPRIREARTDKPSGDSSTSSVRSPRIAIASEAPEDKVKRIKEMIAGAFAYKIQCTITKKNPAKQQNLIKTLDVFTKMVNSIFDPKKALSEEPESARTSFMGELDLLEANIRDGSIVLDKITHQTKEVIKKIREKNKHYQMAQMNQKILYECLLSLMKKLADQGEQQMKVAGAILLDLNERYGKNLETDQHAPAFLLSTMQTLVPHCSDDKKKSCPEIMTWYSDNQKAEFSLRSSFEITREMAISSGSSPRRAITPTPSRRTLSQPTEKPTLTRARSRSLLGDKSISLLSPSGFLTPRGNKSPSRDSEESTSSTPKAPFNGK